MKMPPGVVTGTNVLALLLATGCYGAQRLPLVPSPETRVVGDIRGVVLREEAGGGRIEFSQVSEVRWTSSELIISGTGMTGAAEAFVLRQLSPTVTASFALEDVSHVLVPSIPSGRKVIGHAAAAFLGYSVGAVAFLIAFLMSYR